MIRLALISALEAAEAGDYPLVVEILLTALEELDDGPAPEKPNICEICGTAYRWPGERDAHLDASACVLRWAA